MRLLLTVLIIFLLLASIAGAKPKLTVFNPNFEFGAIPQSSTVTQYWWFHSTGDETVIIDSIKTGCVCALMPLESDSLAPGDSMLVGIYWNIKKRVGNIGRYPYIYTNAKKEAYRIYLTGKSVVHAEKMRPVSIKPYRLELSRTKTKSIDHIDFEIINHSDVDIDIMTVSYPINEVELVLPEVLKANSATKASVKVNEEYLEEEFERSFTIDLVGLDDSRITVPIRRKFYMTNSSK